MNNNTEEKYLKSSVQEYLNSKIYLLYINISN